MVSILLALNPSLRGVSSTNKTHQPRPSTRANSNELPPTPPSLPEGFHPTPHKPLQPRTTKPCTRPRKHTLPKMLPFAHTQKHCCRGHQKPPRTRYCFHPSTQTLTETPPSSALPLPCYGFHTKLYRCQPQTLANSDRL